MVKPIPDGYHTVTPYLVVPDVRQMIDFLSSAFGAELSESLEAEEDVIRHAEVQIGSSRVMIGLARGESKPTTAMFYLYVEDCDGVYARALEAGATSVMEPNDAFYGDRSGGVADAFGNQWWIATHIEDVSDEEMERRSREQWSESQ